MECYAKWFTYCNKALDLLLESDGVLNSMEIFGSTKICKWICFMSFGFLFVELMGDSVLTKIL